MGLCDHRPDLDGVETRIKLSLFHPTVWSFPNSFDGSACGNGRWANSFVEIYSKYSRRLPVGAHRSVSKVLLLSLTPQKCSIPCVRWCRLLISRWISLSPSRQTQFIIKRAVHGWHSCKFSHCPMFNRRETYNRRRFVSRTFICTSTFQSQVFLLMNQFPGVVTPRVT